MRTALARFGVPPRITTPICQFHDDVLACVRLKNGECSGENDGKQGIRQACVLAPLLFNIFFTAELRMAEKRFVADAALWAAMWNSSKRQRRGTRHGPKQSTNRERRRRSTCTLWRMFHTGDADTSPGGLERVTTAMMTACATCRFAVSEAKTEIICL